MNVEKTIKAIEEWYDGDGFYIEKITTEPEGSINDFDQSDAFISVRGVQQSTGISGDNFEGSIYFEFEDGKFITTRFYT